VQNQEGNSPLHVSSARGLLTTAQILLQSGANPFLRNAKDKRAIDYAFGEIKTFLASKSFWIRPFRHLHPRLIPHIFAEEMSTSHESDIRVLSDEVATPFLCSIACWMHHWWNCCLSLSSSSSSFFLSVRVGKGRLWKLASQRVSRPEKTCCGAHDETFAVPGESQGSVRPLIPTLSDPERVLPREQEALWRLIEEKHVAQHRYRLLEVRFPFPLEVKKDRAKIKLK